jgi:hypothetical protein
MIAMIGPPQRAKAPESIPRTMLIPTTVKWLLHIGFTINSITMEYRMLCTPTSTYPITSK